MATTQQSDITRYFKPDYEFHDDPMDKDSFKMRKLKWIIDYKLSPGERDLFLLYTENDANCAKMARHYDVPISTMRIKLLSIKNKIKYYYDH